LGTSELNLTHGLVRLYVVQKTTTGLQLLHLRLAYLHSTRKMAILYPANMKFKEVAQSPKIILNVTVLIGSVTCRNFIYTEQELLFSQISI